MVIESQTRLFPKTVISLKIFVNIMPEENNAYRFPLEIILL